MEYNNNSRQNINGTDIYDKAKWQIDGETPIPEKQVFQHFQIIFDFLKEKDLLSEEGIEDATEPRGYEDIFWNEQVKPVAHPFFHEYYDALISSAEYGSEQFRTNLIEWYSIYEKKLK